MQRLLVVVLFVLCDFYCYAADYIVGPEEKAKLAFKKIANKQLEADGLQNDKDLQSEVETYAESMIEVNYEVMLKPFLK